MERERFEQLLADHLSGEISASDRNELMRYVESDAEAHAEMAAYEQQEELLTRYYKLKAERAVNTGPEWLADVQPAARPPVRPLLRWAAVAALLAIGALSISVHKLYRNQVPTGTAALAKVAQTSGNAFVLSGNKAEPLTAGTPVRQSQKIKTPRDGYFALALNDGNVIEARGGTQFTLEDLPDRLTVVLDGGQVWAHLKNKPLEKKFVVQTGRVRATATGTVYGVEDGLGGTIVAVAEGTVQVERDGQQFSLSAGQAWDSRTNAATTLAPSSIEWSHMQENLASLVAPAKPEAAEALTTMQAVAENTNTTETAPAQIGDLLDLLPLNTTIYLDMRDLSGLIGQFNTSTYAMLAREDALKRWWGSIHGTELTDSITTQTHLREIMAVARQLNGQVVVGVLSPDFVLLGDCRDRRDEAARLLGNALMEISGGKFEEVQRLHERAMVADGILIVSSNAMLARGVVAAISGGAPTGFAASDFNKKVREAVGSNPRLVAAANIAPWMNNWMRDASLARRLDFSGLSGLDHLIIAPGFAGKGMNQAARLGFAGERHGVVNWLAEPAPMRAFNFFSADVHLFASAVIRSPRTMFFDWLQYLMAEKAEVDQAAAREFFESHAALFDAVGSEVAAAIDNPILPLPNIKVALELARPADFSRELDLLVDDWIARNAERGRLAEREQTEYQGFTIQTLHVDGWYLEPSWAVVDDYVVAGPGVEFVKNSIDVWQSGGSIGKNQRLLNLLPAGASNVSLLVYQDVAKAIPVLLTTKLAAGMSAEQKSMIPDLSFMERFRAAGIAYATARKDAIDFYFNTPTGIDFNLGMAAPLVANWLVPRMSVSERFEAYAQASVALEDFAKAALAFQAKNGKLPGSIDELVSGGFIASAPADPFGAGGSLKLVPGPASGSIILYSVGPDGVDDQGVLVADPTSGRSEGDVSIVLPTLDGGPPKVRTEQPAGATASTQ
ncbi:MAG: FecR family protein [Candidatus Sumerlaeia bacterium]